MDAAASQGAGKAIRKAVKRAAVLSITGWIESCEVKDRVARRRAQPPAQQQLRRLGGRRSSTCSSRLRTRGCSASAGGCSTP
eukprot:1140813-Prymnesium_polylepis.1